WRVRDGEPDLFAPAAASLPDGPHDSTFSVPARFIELAQTTILHRDPERFALLYRLLWRLRMNHDLLDIVTDPDVVRVREMVRAVRRDEHKMHAFVRFREIGRERDTQFVA